MTTAIADAKTMTTDIVFLTSMADADCEGLFAAMGVSQYAVVRDLKHLEAVSGRVLLSFGTSVIVPEGVLHQYSGGAYNIHAASPDYPGRDPHHWAVYDGVTRYGATAHVMTSKVDAGPVIDVEWFEVAENTRPETLLQQANTAALKLMQRLIPRLGRGEKPSPLAGVCWGGVKRSRNDLLNKCKLEPSISREEFERIYDAFDGGAYNNLTIELHGHVFRIEKQA